MSSDSPQPASSFGGNTEGDSQFQTEGNDDQDVKTDSAAPNRSVNVPRQSACVQAQLKVLRQNLERLMSERTVLFDVKDSLRIMLSEMDREIASVRRMHDLGVEAHTFMGEHDDKFDDGVGNRKGKPGKDNQSEPKPGCSKNMK